MRRRSVDNLWLPGMGGAAVALEPADAWEREQALDVRRSFIVQAPAGSGKTELLIQRFLALLPTVVEPESIVAITFTIKAAAEMRGRVLDALRTAVSGREPEAAHERATFRLASEALRRDRERGWGLLSNPGRLRIQTIDALCASITRQMPWTARLGAMPGVVEDASELYREAARHTFQLLNSDDGAVSLAIETLLLHVENDVAAAETLLARMLAERDQWLRLLGATHDRAGLRRTIESALERVVSDALERVVLSIDPGLAREMAAMARYAAVQLGTTLAIASFPEPTAANLPAFRWIADVFLTDAGACRKSVDARTGFAAKSREKQRMSALLAVLQGETTITDLLCSVRKLPDPRFREEQWAVLNAALDILPQAVHELRMTFAEHGKVDFAEIALRALETLGADEPTDLGLILGSRIAHLLMDEFQDTSVLQFELARRLTAGWNPGDGRTLFLVGDPMQSIYRFRQAEVGLFLEARHSGIGDVGLRPLSLSVNFRSAPAIVDWVNQTFATVFPAQEDIAAGAVPYSASTPHKSGSQADAVMVHPFLERDDAAEADLVLEIVRRATGSATTAILVRARTHLPIIAGRLRDNGVPFRAVEIETLAERPAVQDLLALTRALLHRGDRLSWLAVLRAPYCGLTLADLHAIASTDRKASIRDLLERNAGQVSVDGRQRLDRVMPVLERALSLAGRIPLRELVESTWVALGGPHALKAEADLDDALAYLDLLAAADAGGDLPSFELFNERIERLFAHPDPEAGEAVQLMTIHKAKGLEFDNVILPGLGKPPAQDDAKLLVWVERNGPEGGELLISPSSPRRGSDSICDFITELDREKGRQESARLLYVGCTRAKHRLDVIGHTFVTKSGELHEPDSESLLKVLWPAVEPTFRRKWEHARSEAATKQQPEATRPPRQIRRLISAWNPLPLPEPAQWAGSLPDARSASARSAFEGIEAVHRHVGTVVHRLLERVARERPDQWNGERVVAIRPGIQAALRELGVSPSELDQAVSRVQSAVSSTLGDPRGRWILSRHEDARSEFEVGGTLDGSVYRVTIDRTFLDEDGVRWIVDYKTGAPGDEPVEAFLDAEQARYSGQLEIYARLWQQIENRPVRLALYFPSFGGWREWPAGADYSLSTRLDTSADTTP